MAQNDEEFKTDWVNHPYTRYLLASTQKDRESALQGLIQTAGASSDPKVLYAFAQYYALDKKVKALETGNK